jgi:hypothetical protein
MDSVKLIKDGKKIIFGEFAYTIQHKLIKTLRWKCSQKSSKKRPGILTTNRVKYLYL